MAAIQASVASMTARLVSKLSLGREEEPVDLGDLRAPEKGFIVPRFYLVGRLNTTKPVIFDKFRSAVKTMWKTAEPVDVAARAERFLFTFNNERDMVRVRGGGPWCFQRAMIVLNDYDGFSDIRQVPLDFIRVWVVITGLPPALMTEATVRLVGETIGSVIRIDHTALGRDDARLRVTLPLTAPVKSSRRLRVSSSDVITVEYQYERLVGWCRTCNRLDHGGQRCPSEVNPEPDNLNPNPPSSVPMMIFRANSAPGMALPSMPSFSSLSNLFPKEKRQIQIREVPEAPSPAKVAGVRRPRSEEGSGSGKRSKHSLELIPLELGPEDLGFMVGCDGSIGLARKSPKRRGRPRGSKNRKPAAKLNFDSMASSSGTAGLSEGDGTDDQPEPHPEEEVVAEEEVAGGPPVGE